MEKSSGPANSFRALGDLLIAAQQSDPSPKKFNPRLQLPDKPKRRDLDFSNDPLARQSSVGQAGKAFRMVLRFAPRV